MNIEKIFESDRVKFYRTSNNPDFIRLLAERASYYAVHPRVDEFCRGKTPKDIYYIAKNKIVYRKDPRLSEKILSPALIIDELRKGKPVNGDCDDKSLFLAACLANMGYYVRLVGAMFKKEGKGLNHVYVEYSKDKMNWIPLEPSTKTLSFGQKSPNVVPIMKVELAEPKIEESIEDFQLSLNASVDKETMVTKEEALWSI